MVFEYTALILYCLPKKVSEYDQEIPQSQIADNPVAPRGREPFYSIVHITKYNDDENEWEAWQKAANIPLFNGCI